MLLGKEKKRKERKLKRVWGFCSKMLAVVGVGVRLEEKEETQRKEREETDMSKIFLIF